MDRSKPQRGREVSVKDKVVKLEKHLKIYYERILFRSKSKHYTFSTNGQPMYCKQHNAKSFEAEKNMLEK
jgi:hypothetical protein